MNTLQVVVLVFFNNSMACSNWNVERTNMTFYSFRKRYKTSLLLPPKKTHPHQTHLFHHYSPFLGFPWFPIFVSTMKLTLALATLAVSLGVSQAYPLINADVLNCRTGPGTSYSVQQQLKPPLDIKITCQEPGTVVNGVKLWDKTQFGCYVSDYYVKTGTGDYVAPHCSSSGGSGYCKLPNDAGLNLIKEFEGFVPRPAPDPIGLPTVGYGHLCQTKGCSEVKYSFPLTVATATALLKDDLPRYSSCLASYLKSNVSLNQNQWAALVSWTFNVGCGNVKTSTLVSRLNNGENPNTVAAQELPRWNKAGGKVLPGLTRRRAAEVKLFQTANSKKGFPNCA